MKQIMVILILAAWTCLIMMHAQAQDTAHTPEETALLKKILEDASRSADITFQQLPPITDERTRNMVLKYNLSARGWWAGLRCKFKNAEISPDYEKNLTMFTNLMSIVFASDFDKPPAEGNTYSQIVQMNALNAMSASKFYDCSEYAEQIWIVGADAAAHAADAVNSLHERK